MLVVPAPPNDLGMDDAYKASLGDAVPMSEEEIQSDPKCARCGIGQTESRRYNVKSLDCSTTGCTYPPDEHLALNNHLVEAFTKKGDS